MSTRVNRSNNQAKKLGSKLNDLQLKFNFPKICLRQQLVELLI